MNNDIILKEDLREIVEDVKELASEFQNKTILVVGGKGFLGTYFVRTLIELNKIYNNSIKIIILDSLITIKDSTLFNEANVKLIEGDVSKKINIKEKIDYIIHAASIASPPIYRKFPIKTVDVNYQGTKNLLDLAKDNNVKTFLFLSSSEIYGDPTIIPTPETYWGYVSSVGPRACYDESKRLAETICMLYFQQYNVPIKIVRPFNVYGPFLNLNDGRMIPDFMKNGMNEQKIIIHSDGTPTRSFCYVSDAIRGFFRVLLLGKNGEIFNVGNDEEVSVKQCAELIKDTINNSVAIIIQKSEDPNYTIDNPQRRCPNLDHIKKAVEYYPSIMLKEGILRLYKWYQGNKE